MEESYWQVLAVLLLILWVNVIFGIAGRGSILLLQVLWAVVRFPFSLFVRAFDGIGARRRRRNYEVLATYMPLVSENPRLLQYLETLIEEGIPPGRLEAALARHARLAAAVDARRRVDEVLAEAEKEAGIADVAVRHQKVLAESAARLEKLRFKERALEGLVDKIRAKYQV
ncbi:MAG: hypothetical protein HY720_05830 [Planctomycetes bacterium]|nr:hypothetical protein [Planctomycetota bacterium]